MSAPAKTSTTFPRRAWVGIDTTQTPPRVVAAWRVPGGLRRVEVFMVRPATCTRPLLDCPVVVEGEVSRGDYGMGRWGVALGDGVRFHLSLRAHEPGTT